MLRGVRRQTNYHQYVGINIAGGTERNAYLDFITKM